MTTVPWYEELFNSGDYVRFWLGGEDAPRIPAERTEHETEFIISALDLPAGAHVLDLCCGYGRHSVSLARRGYRLTGVDFSPLHLEMARRVAEREGASVEWVQADMRDIPRRLDGQLDAVINIFTAFGYFEQEAEDQKVLEGVAQALKSGGKFLIDLLNFTGLVRRFQPKDWQEQDGAFVLHERRLDLQRGRSEETLTIVERDGSRRQTGLSVRLYTLTELMQMLGRAGLRFSHAWGDFDGSDLGLDSRRMIVLSEKT